MVFIGFIIKIKNTPIIKIVNTGAIIDRIMDLPALRTITNSLFLEMFMKKQSEVNKVIMGIKG
mgnify:FL=1